jgi:hypothetical protein
MNTINNIISQEQVPFNVDIGNMDISFINEMVAGGINDDGSPLVGDVSFEDDNNYNSANISDSDANDYLKSLNLPTLF